ncbi:YebC/PmpR family DNA-binding transcriptional regulator [Blattabacterium cuenoti]|uniref:YebC/PmpR family DNA-binding transcriptional regulator n=1 Tax=Blattabacterium cuenoti TaxID=1653831 RepID=UPI00163C2415|nr:YebC/PmpR family DNA-binding transcriptional regulator [Blattabacterium cuenoti]
MSGHSKWTNIQHRKSHKDFIKSKKFSKIIKEISIAAKESGGNKTFFRLKNAIFNAKAINIPKHTIEKAIKNALPKKTNNYQNFNLEGQIHGISLIIECNTDNSIKTTYNNIKSFFNKKGGRLCNNGELIHLFDRIGFFSIKKKNINGSLENFELMVIDFGAQDFIKNNNMIYIYTKFKFFGSMKNYLKKLKIIHISTIKHIAKHTKIILKEKEKKILNFIEELKIKNKNINNIYSNLIKNKK